MAFQNQVSKSTVNQASSPGDHSVHHRLHRVQACFHSSVLNGWGENNSHSHGLWMELCNVCVLINTVPNVLMTSIGHVLALWKPSLNGTTVWSIALSNGAKCSVGPKSMLKKKRTLFAACLRKWPDHVSLDTSRSHGTTSWELQKPTDNCLYDNSSQIVHWRNLQKVHRCQFLGNLLLMWKQSEKDRTPPSSVKT